VIALVGPAGMGKTTTLAKLAARYVLKYGAQHVALVSLDSYRIGAQEQLKTLGRILNVPVTLVDPGQSLTQALAPLARKRVVLIDSAGLPASDPALHMQLETLASRGIKARNYLVLAATSQNQVLKAAYHSYKRCGLAGCILTKLDEATSLGEVLGLAIGQRLPVAYLTDGPRIPDDLQVPRSHQLVSRAVGLQSAEDPSEDTMAEMFAGLYQHPARRAG
jgi:flagellar biosynthesis protein FlhF